MSITIPPVPETIVNPDNLYNDVYGDLPPLAWRNPDFHSRLGWIDSLVAFKVTAWYATVNQSPGAAPLRTSTMFRAEVSDGVGFDFDVRSVMELPETVAYTLLRILHPEIMPVVKPYPGFLALHPATSNPVGAPWPDHPWKGRKLFHARPETTYKPGDIFETPEARYQKVRFVVRSGSGPFGVGGKVAEAWELIYSR